MNKSIAITVLILIYSCAFSQQLPQDNQFLLNKFSLNPAYAGVEESFESYLTYRNNWTGIKNAPESELITVNGPMLNSGIGATVMNNHAGIFRNTLVSMSYAHHLKISDNQKIHLGLSAGYFTGSADFSAISNKEIYDPVVGENQLSENSCFDAGFGIAYQFRQMHLGVSVPRLLETSLNNRYLSDQPVYTLARQFKIHASNTFNLSDDYKLDVTEVVSKSSGNPVYFEGALSCKFKNRLWAGLTYRKGNYLGINTGLIYNRFVMNYAYEFGFSGPVTGSSGTHEVSIGIIIGKSKKFTNDLPFIKSSKPYNEWVDK